MAVGRSCVARVDIMEEKISSTFSTDTNIEDVLVYSDEHHYIFSFAWRWVGFTMDLGKIRSLHLVGLISKVHRMMVIQK